MNVLSTLMAVIKFVSIQWDHFSVAVTGDMYYMLMELRALV